MKIIHLTITSLADGNNTLTSDVSFENDPAHHQRGH